MADVILLMGGNVGDVAVSLKRSRELLEAKAGRVVSCSSEIKSEPWGFVNGAESVPQFTNQAVWIETDLLPEQLLGVIHEIEREVGRDRAGEREEREERGERYASRVVDIDMIFYDDMVLNSDRLTLPHPLMQEREFVLRPMVEIVSEWRHPVLGMSCEELLNSLI